jgi:hypothetical protein
MTEIQKQVTHAIASIVPDYGRKLSAPPGLDDSLLTQHGYSDDQLSDIADTLEGVFQLQFPDDFFEQLGILHDRGLPTARHFAILIERFHV